MPITIPLSESAVAVLRFRIKGHRMPVTDQRLPAFRELADAGIMEPVGDDFQFTGWGMAHREAILDRESERIERERYAPPNSDLSYAARERLRRHLAGDCKVTSENLAAYRELADARIMIPLHSFVGG